MSERTASQVGQSASAQGLERLARPLARLPRISSSEPHPPQLLFAHISEPTSLLAAPSPRTTAARVPAQWVWVFFCLLVGSRRAGHPTSRSECERAPSECIGLSGGPAWTPASPEIRSRAAFRFRWRYLYGFMQPVDPRLSRRFFFLVSFYFAEHAGRSLPVIFSHSSLSPSLSLRCLCFN